MAGVLSGRGAPVRAFLPLASFRARGDNGFPQWLVPLWYLITFCGSFTLAHLHQQSLH